MLAIEVQLLTGRFHATPWGRHVNEGEVEWPPSPWRLVRALLATGFSKLGWTSVPDDARGLVSALAGQLPVLALPPGNAAHTRHFMPPFKGNKDKVIDAFVDVGRGGKLGIEWDVQLDPAQLALLDALLGRLSYLGRAESWVEARRVTAIGDDLSRCLAGPSAPGPGFERVPLLAPLPSDAYAAWREERLAAELSAELTRKRAAAIAKGKKAPAKLSAKEVQKIASAFPETLVDALLADTAALQRDGWSQPPGSQWVSYWRHERVLAPAPLVRSEGHSPQAQPDTAVLALASDTRNGERLPRFTDALLRLELLHKALVRKSCEARGNGDPSPSLSGKQGGVRLEGHRHATLVPLCLHESSSGPGSDREPERRTIDHILIHAPMQLDEAAQEALRRVRVVYGGDMRFFVSLVALGSRQDLTRTVDVLKDAKVWISSTPFVPPRHLKSRGKNTLLGQVLAELESRGLPRPERVEVELEGNHWLDLDVVSEHARPATRWRHFRRARLEPDRRPPSTRGFGLRLTFATPVPGPLTLGYASHFGLGAFAPVL